jgi:hypothetical protein
MADNRQCYGFRWSVAANGGRPLPAPERVIVASAQSFDINGGASNVSIGPGDVVRSASTGGVVLCDGAEGAGGALSPRFIVVGVEPYYDAANGVMAYGSVLPSDVTYGTNLERQSKLLVVPVDAGTWEIDCDEATTATTLAAYQAFIGEHANHTHDITATNTRPTPRLDISTHNTTSTLVWNIVGISPTQDNQDFSGNYVKLLVRANVVQLKTAGILGV